MKGASNKVILREFAYELVYSPKKGSRNRTISHMELIESVSYF